MGKRKKNFLPKRVGRLRIPKPLRQGVVGAAISSAAGQAVIAALVLKAGSHVVHLARARDHEEMDFAEHDARRMARGLNGVAASEPHAPGAAVRAKSLPRGPNLNVKHALGQAAIAFVLGLSHPKSAGRSRKPADGAPPAAAPPPGAAADHPEPAASVGAAPGGPEKPGGPLALDSSLSSSRSNAPRQRDWDHSGAASHGGKRSRPISSS